MNTTHVKDSTLFISLRSPFARRVRLAFLEDNVVFSENVCDVFKPSQELIDINPLVRVPALRLSNAKVLIESHLILQYYYQNANSRLLNSNDVQSIFYWSALSTGLAEKTVEYFLDSLRPDHSRDIDISNELNQISHRILNKAENQFQTNRREYLVGNQITQADLDLGTALTYLGLRYSKDWYSNFPLTFQYLQKLEDRPSFKKTHPPV
jgi:glutathione S-transferase